MALENKLGSTSFVDLAREEERISKKKAVDLFDAGLLNLRLKAKLHQRVHCSLVDKEDYLLAMERSPIRDTEIKHILKKRTYG